MAGGGYITNRYAKASYRPRMSGLGLGTFFVPWMGHSVDSEAWVFRAHHEHVIAALDANGQCERCIGHYLSALTVNKKVATKQGQSQQSYFAGW